MEESLDCALIPPRLHQNVGRFAVLVLVNRTSQILRLATDLEKDVVEISVVAPLSATRASA